MPMTIETVVYEFDELDDHAREKARTWYRETDLDYDWFAFVYDDFERVCDILGITLESRAVRLYGGGVRQKPCIWFTGFWSQGDGACFEGVYRYANGAAKRIRDYTPQDSDLHEIADALQAAQRRNFYQLSARMRHTGRYYHAYAMEISVERDDPAGRDVTPDAEAAVVEAMRDLARWLYNRLEDEHDHLTSDEVVDEGLRANAYTFTASGEQFG